MNLADTIGTVMLTIACACIAGVCLIRATIMDGRAMLLPRLAYAGLFTNSIAAVLIPVFHWNSDWILLGFTCSILALMWSNREAWRSGVPDFVLKTSFRYPNMERRKSERRKDAKPGD